MLDDYSELSILHGEDDAADVRIMEMVLEKIAFNGCYQQFDLGQQVLEWALKRGEFREGKHVPANLIILDIGLPGLDGKSVLQQLRQDTVGKAIPVLMLSGSNSIRDYHECISAGCNAYIQKTSDFDNFLPSCCAFIEGWARLNKQKFY